MIAAVAHMIAETSRKRRAVGKAALHHSVETVGGRWGTSVEGHRAAAEKGLDATTAEWSRDTASQTTGQAGKGQ